MTGRNQRPGRAITHDHMQQRTLGPQSGRTTASGSLEVRLRMPARDDPLILALAEIPCARVFVSLSVRLRFCTRFTQVYWGKGRDCRAVAQVVAEKASEKKRQRQRQKKRRGRRGRRRKEEMRKSRRQLVHME